MPWFPDIANPAFCETLHLRKIILERQRPSWSTRQRVLEPGSAEFIAALAAGSNSRRILHVGCGLSTIALAAAARATGGRLECVDTDEHKQEIVCQYILELGLQDYVDFYLEKPSCFISQRDGFDFVLFTGEPESYIESFDLLRFKQAAIIVAYNALDDATNEYIKHVRQQPGIDSSTLPVGRGIEVSKILSWDAFKSGRKAYCHCDFWDDDLSNSNSTAAATATSSYRCCASNSDGFFDQDSVYESVGELNSGSYDSKNGILRAIDDAHEQEEGIISPTVSVGTSLEEESARIHAVGDVGELNSEADDEISIQFKNVDLQTEIKVEGPDRHMLLTDITMALNEANVSVQGAKISTQNNRVEDVFYVVDAETKQQLDLDQQEYVRTKILKRILERRQVIAA